MNRRIANKIRKKGSIVDGGTIPIRKFMHVMRVLGWKEVGYLQYVDKKSDLLVDKELAAKINAFAEKFNKLSEQ